MKPFAKNLTLISFAFLGACDLEKTPFLQTEAGFAFTPDAIYEDCATQFSNLSANANSYVWDFGDGETSAEENPAHVFEAPGTYTVTLIASNGTETDSMEQSVKVFQKIRFKRPYPNGTGGFNGFDVLETPEGGFVFCGTFNENSQTDIGIIKTDKWGEILKNKSFGGDDYEASKSLIATSDGGYLICGTTSSQGNGLNDIYLLKVDRDINFMWEKTIGDTGDDFGASVAEISGGGYMVLGSIYPEGVYLIKTSGAGVEQNRRKIGGGTVVIPTADGSFLVGGQKLQSANNFDFYFVKLSKNLDIELETTIPTSENDQLYALINTADGGYAACGTFNAGGLKPILIKLGSNLNHDWTKKPEYTNPIVIANALTQGVDGGYLLTCFIEQTAGSGFGSNDLSLYKTKADGSQDWVEFYNDPVLYERAFKCITTSDCGYCATGSYAANNQSQFQALLLKVDSKGKFE